MTFPKLSTLKTLAKFILSIFFSTYACESLFPKINYIKNSKRNAMTDESSSTCVLLKVTKYEPDMKYLTTTKISLNVEDSSRIACQRYHGAHTKWKFVTAALGTGKDIWTELFINVILFICSVILIMQLTYRENVLD